jgi:hypothetical protein
MSYSGMLEIGSTAALAGGSLITFNDGELVALNTATVSGGLQVNGSSDLAAATGATLTMNGTYTSRTALAELRRLFRQRQRDCDLDHRQPDGPFPRTNTA